MVDTRDVTLASYDATCSAASLRRGSPRRWGKRLPVRLPDTNDGHPSKRPTSRPRRRRAGAGAADESPTRQVDTRTATTAAGSPHEARHCAARCRFMTYISRRCRPINVRQITTSARCSCSSHHKPAYRTLATTKHRSTVAERARFHSASCRLRFYSGSFALEVEGEDAWPEGLNWLRTKRLQCANLRAYTSGLLNIRLSDVSWLLLVRDQRVALRKMRNAPSPP